MRSSNIGGQAVLEGIYDEKRRKVFCGSTKAGWRDRIRSVGLS